ncbi:MAG: hypothetical protein LAP86_18295 [Acidobacteriia bacterium]|nr:hypothetical protein [Terriglobia bacterium]
MATQEVTPVTQVTDPLEPLRQKAKDTADRVTYLRSRLAKTKKAIETIGTASAAFSSLNAERRDLEKQLDIAELEAGDAQLVLGRKTKKLAREKFTAMTAEALQLRHEIAELMREASDAFGRLIELQRAMPSVANDLADVIGPPGQSFPVTPLQDRKLIEQLNEPINPYLGPWAGSRRFIPVELDARCIRLQPTQKL